MGGVLEGLKVVSMGHAEAVPAASVWMADWGAEVIKVEPLTGDSFRGIIRFHGMNTTVKVGGDEVRWGFQLLNRNQKSLAVDLKKKSGKDILYKLVHGADVFISNYDLDALKKLKMDYATLGQVNPKLIYAVICGYGSVGPYKDERGYDLTAGWARGGMQYMMMGDPEQPPPRPRGGMIDKGVAGPHVVAGILAALLHRERTGKGEELEVSLFHSSVWVLASDIQSAMMGTLLKPKSDRRKEENPLSNTYRTKDNRWFQIAEFQSDVAWPRLCRAIEKPELENDPRFNNMETRRQNCEELIRILDKIFASKTIDKWDRCFLNHNFIYSRIQSPTEIINDPQALANDFFVELPHPAGTMKTVATPVTFHQNPASVRTPAPELGQHTEEILLDLGYRWDDIANLKEQGVIL